MATLLFWLVVAVFVGFVVMLVYAGAVAPYRDPPTPPMPGAIGDYPPDNPASGAGWPTADLRSL